jgi:hypothetical protein
MKQRFQDLGIEIARPTQTIVVQLAQSPDSTDEVTPRQLKGEERDGRS